MDATMMSLQIEKFYCKGSKRAVLGSASNGKAFGNGIEPDVAFPVKFPNAWLDHIIMKELTP
jgi:hypothetical protein